MDAWEIVRQENYTPVRTTISLRQVAIASVTLSYGYYVLHAGN